jgi:hypothetical protein
LATARFGPIGGIVIADYYVYRRKELDVAALYQEDGKYRFTHGFSLVAFSAHCRRTRIFQDSVTVKILDPTSVPAFFVRLYDYAWFVGFAIAFVVYLVLRTLTGGEGRYFAPAYLQIDMKLPELQFDHQPRKYDGPSPMKSYLRKEFLNRNLLYYKKPVMFVEGKMQYLWDEQGRRYLDALGGIVTVRSGIVIRTWSRRAQAE